MSNIPEYNYMKIFSNTFFDVDAAENKAVKDIVSQVDIVLSSLIVRFGEVENELDYRDDGKNSEEIDYDESRTRLVIMTFVRKIMEQLDAINILYSKCSFVQAQLILRSMVENVVSLEFILKDDTQLRATAYFMEHHYQEIDNAKEYLSDDSPLKGNIPESEFEQAKKDWDKKEQALNNLISKNAMIGKVDSLRQGILSTKRIKRMKWYEIGGPKNFKALMTEVGLEKYYSGIYGGLSFETHALNASTEMKFKEDGNVYLNRIRSPHDGNSTFSLACTFAVSALFKLYKYLGDGAEESVESLKFFKEFQEQRDVVDDNLSRIVLG